MIEDARPERLRKAEEDMRRSMLSIFYGVDPRAVFGFVKWCVDRGVPLDLTDYDDFDDE